MKSISKVRRTGLWTFVASGYIVLYAFTRARAEKKLEAYQLAERRSKPPVCLGEW